MKNTITSIKRPMIKIKRIEGFLSSVDVEMPVWIKSGADVFMVDIPLLGIKTFAKDYEDGNGAVKESLDLFFTASEKLGVGLESELGLLGWEIVLEDVESGIVCMRFGSYNFGFTGEKIISTIDISYHLTK